MPMANPLNIASYEQPANGVASQVGDSIVYTPAVGFIGSDSFAYTVSDSFGGLASATVSVIVELPPTPPQAPNGVEAHNGEDGTAIVRWTDTSDNETSFEIERQNQAQAAQRLERNDHRPPFTGANAVSHVDGAGTGTFRYRARSVNEAGASAWSAWAEVTVTSSGGGGGGGQKCHPKRGC